LRRIGLEKAKSKMTNLIPETEIREVTELNAKINLLLAMSTLADSELRHCNENLTRITGEMSSKDAELKAILSSKDAELEAILSSTSWRITAPLRWLRKKIGQWR